MHSHIVEVYMREIPTMERDLGFRAVCERLQLAKLWKDSSTLSA